MPRLVTLGSLALVDDEGALLSPPLRGRNLGLLAVLARASEGGVSRDRLAALFWPDSDEERARHSLDQALYTVRRGLGDVFQSGAANLALDPTTLRCDAVDFDDALARGALEDAVDLYGGAFLDGFHLSKAREFEGWVDSERGRLESSFVDALEQLADAAIERGAVEEAAKHQRRLVSTRPLSGRFTLALMHSLSAAGDRSAALQEARAHADRVQKELGVGPDAAVQALESELRASSEATAVDRTPSEPQQTTIAPPGDRPVSTDTVAVAPPRRRSRVLPWVALGLVGGAIALALGVGSRSEPASLGARPRVNVPTFEAEAGDPELSTIGAMAADWITEGLVRTGLLRVVDVDRRADLTVSGRVYRDGDSVRFHARITAADGTISDAVDAAAGRQETSQAIERLRQRVIGALATRHDPRLTTWADAILRPPVYEAHQAFVRGLEHFAMPRDVDAAITSFEQASALDSSFAAPRLWLAWAQTLRGDYGQAEASLRSAAALRDEMSELERAWYDRIQAAVAGDNEASLRAARRMAEIAPTSAWLVSRANAALDTGRPAEAIAALEEVGVENLGAEVGYGFFLLAAAHHELGAYEAELDVADRGVAVAGLSHGFQGPGVPALAALGRHEALGRRLDELRNAAPLEGGVPAGIGSLAVAVEELRAHGFEEAAGTLAEHRLPIELERAGNDPSGRVASAGVETLYATGAFEEALRLLDSVDLGRSKWELGMRGRIAVHLGDETAARASVEALEDCPGAYDLGECTFQLASIEAARGNGEFALELLERAFAEGLGGPARYRLHVDRDFDELRPNPDFQRLIRPND